MATTKKKSSKKKSSKDKTATKPVESSRPKRGINREKITEEREKLDTGGGGDIWSPDPGETIVYVHPPCRADDDHPLTAGVPYVPMEVHYQVGGSNGPMCASLDKEANPIMTHPLVRAQLKKRGVKIKKGECPIKKWLAEDANEVEEDRAKRQTKWVWGVTPISFKAPKSKKFAPIAPQPAILMAGITIHDGIMEVLDEVGDITDYEQAVFIKITKKGSKRNNIKYTVIADPKTLRAPVKLDKEFVDMVEKALEPDGDCDLFKFAGNLFKSTGDVEKILASGGSVATDDDEDEDDDDEDEDDDDDEDDDEDDEDEDEEEEDDEDEDGEE
jgi:hypothetical protein